MDESLCSVDPDSGREERKWRKVSASLRASVVESTGLSSSSSFGFFLFFIVFVLLVLVQLFGNFLGRENG